MGLRTIHSHQQRRMTTITTTITTTMGILHLKHTHAASGVLRRLIQAGNANARGLIVRHVHNAM